jgi:hypothetical protein
VQDKPKLFSTFLMWLLADLFHDLPEVGDVDKPKLVFFLDEAHLLFDDASEAFLDAVARTVRLIRSKGVGVFFVTQTPKDVPAEVLGPARQPRAARAARLHPRRRQGAQGDGQHLPEERRLRPDRAAHLHGHRRGGGDDPVRGGTPTPVAWTRLRPPASLMGPLDPAVLEASVQGSPLLQEYGAAVDRDSAYERLLARVVPADEVGPVEGEPEPGRGRRVDPPDEPEQEERGAGAGAAVGAVLGSSMFRSFARSAASAAGREIGRSLFGTAPRRRRPSSGRTRRRSGW